MPCPFEVYPDIKGVVVLGDFRCRVVPRIWIKGGQEPTVLAIGAGEGYLDIYFSSPSYLYFSHFV